MRSVLTPCASSVIIGLLLILTHTCLAQTPADGLTDEQRKRMAYHLEGIDPTVRNAYLAAEVIDLVPDGFELVQKKNYIYNTDYAAQHFRKGAAEYRITLRREKPDSKTVKAADRYAKWFAPQANNVAKFYDKNMGLGKNSVCLATKFPGSRLVEAYAGRWTLSVRQTGMIGSKKELTKYFIQADEVAYDSEDQAVNELKSVASAIWSRLKVIAPQTPAPKQTPSKRTSKAKQPSPVSKLPTIVPAKVPVNQSVNLSQQDQQYLDLIKQMDELLHRVEQPLQESLTQVRLLSESQDKMRQQMRELSKLRSSVNDDALKKKIQNRINSTAQILRETAVQIRHVIADARMTALEAKRAIDTLFNSKGFGDLYLAANTRRELIAARVLLLEAQIAFNSGDLDAAQRAASSMRSNFRLRGHADYIDGMSLLQQGKSLDALAAFRNAREFGNQSPGASFKALERRTEIHVLRTLKRLSAETSKAFDDDLSNWIKDKGELNQPQDKTQFQWLVARFLKRPWYDTISGVTGTGIAEADQRGREVGIVADDMAVNQVGLNFIIALRENMSLSEIQKLSTNQLRNEAAKRWGRDLPDDQIKRMRHAIHHVFQMPEVKALADGTAHLKQSAFSDALTQQIKLQDRWATAADVAAMGASMIDSWTVITTLAPSARMSFSGTGQLVRTADATERFKNTVTLGEWFAASRPVEGALRTLNETNAGRVAIRTVAKVQDFADQGVLESIAVTGANMVLDTGVAYAAKEYLGQPGEMLVDAMTTLGVTNPQLYQHTLEKMTQQRVIDFAESMRQKAIQQRTQLSKLDELVQALPAIGSDAADLAAFRAKLDGIDLDVDLADRVEGLAIAVTSGNQAMVKQARLDLDRLRAHQSHLANQANQAAAQFRQAIPTRSNPPSIPDAETPSASTRQTNPIGDPLETQPVQTARNPSAQQDAPLAEAVGDPLAAEPARTIGNPSTQRNTPSNQAVGDPLAVEPVGTVRHATAQPRSTAGDPLNQTPDRSTLRNTTDAEEPSSTLDRSRQPAAPLFSLTSDTDQLLSEGRFTEAIESYQRQITQLPTDHPHRARLEARIDVARQALVDRQRISEAMSHTAMPTQTPKIFDQPDSQALIEGIVKETNPDGQWIPVGAEIPSASDTASRPRFVKDAAGRNLAVTKNANGMAGHPEGRAEVLASLVAEKLGRDTPRSRLSNFTIELQGSAQRLVISELMPHGIELKDLNPTTAQLLARKKAITEDFVFAMFLGDGDRHFGNLRITPDERLIGFDYGLADILPTHPYRQEKILKTVSPMYEEAKRKLDVLINTPGTPQSQIDQVRRELSSLQVRTLYFNLERPMKIPSPTDPDFTAFVEQTMNMHMTWGSRQWTDHELFVRSMTYEDFLPHIQRLEEAMQKPGVLDGIVNQAMQGHPDIEYTRELLRKRLEIMREVFRARYPSRMSMNTEPVFRLIPGSYQSIPRRMAA